MNKPTDFNDMMKLSGLDAVRVAIESAKPPKAAGSPSTAGGNVWAEPQALTAKIESEPYPIDALPDTIRAAVEEVIGFVKAPIPLAASSALGVLSLAIQANVDVQRAENLQGPSSLFLMTIADSGERKSTCDKHFSKAIQVYQNDQQTAAGPLLKNHNADMTKWDAQYSGVKQKIQQVAKNGKSSDTEGQTLRDLEHTKPEPPRVSRLLYADVTPEALAYSLAKNWPSGGVVSAEAGIVFGSHGMGKDSVMRNLGLLNQLWDGGSLTIDRRTSESFTVKGARLTMSLQVQEPTLREFFEKSGALARGTGFLARFLIAWPESTQGQRPFTEPPTAWPHVAAFNRRIAEILAQPAPVEKDGSLAPQTLTLSPEAKTAWIAYHDEIEGMLGKGKELYAVRDVASKSADNAVRIAALFHIFDGGQGPISKDIFDGAARISAWYLNESLRFFGELALPPEVADAVRLDRWLVEHCQREHEGSVSTREAQRTGPVRDKDRLESALSYLGELDRVEVVKDGKKRIILLNPALLGVS